VSTLLDVLHKRPSRSHVAVPGPQPAQATTVETPTLELGLASDHDAPPAGEAGAETAGESTGEMLKPVPTGDTTAFRRWSDAVAVAAEPGPDSAPGPSVAVAAPARRLPNVRVMALLGLVVTAAGVTAWWLAQAPEESFLATPGELPQAPPDAAPADEFSTSQEEPEVLPVVVRKKADVIDEVPVAASSQRAEVAATAWYDQPALPAAPADSAPVPVIEISRETVTNPLFDTLRGAYEAMTNGDAARAESLYREVLAADPANVDALLGLATLAARGGRTEEARDLYVRVQRLEPKNSTAMAALSALPGAGSAAGSESQLKSMLREQPAAAGLHFALGLRYLAARRWPDAQMAFFEAVRHDPRNPDYAFNLAVSLDQLGQARPAISYYQRAIELASGGQQFDVTAARARLAVLQAGQG
jgi:Tfp pilus assembly protein PilF